MTTSYPCLSVGVHQSQRLSRNPLATVALVRLADPFAGDHRVAILGGIEGVREHPAH